MWHTKTITAIFILLVTTSCSQNPSRHVELELPVPQATQKHSVKTDKSLQASVQRNSVVTEWVPANLWDRMRAGFQLSEHTPDNLPTTLSWYHQRQYHMDRVVEQSAPYLYFVLEEVEKRGMPSEIALLPVVESNYQPFAYSRSGAAGIWQFIPSTGKHYGLMQNEWYDGRRDIYTSTRAALDFLQDLYQRLDNDWLLALAAYNSGGTTVERAVRTATQTGKKGDFWSIRPLLPKETRHYVPKLLAISAIARDPERHDITLKEISNEPYLTRLQIDTRISLKVAAKLAGLSLYEFRQLNPAFNQMVTPPEGPHDLMLPIEKSADFKWHLSRLSPGEKTGWIYHTVTAGENLTIIARKYGTIIATLKRSNQLGSDVIRVGDRLKILSSNSSRQNLAVQSNTRHTSSFSNADVTHTVTNGDTLWDLARHYRVTIAQLAEWNAITAEKPLIPGQKLLIRSRDNT